MKNPKLKKHLPWLLAAVFVIAAGTLYVFAGPQAAMLTALPLPFLGTLAFYTETPSFSFEANAPADLVGKEGWPFELVSASTQKIQLLGSGIYLGVLFERLEGSAAWKCHLRGPIRKAVAGGSINAPGYVKMGTSGIVAASSGDKACGVVISPATIASGTICSYVAFDCVAP